MALHLFVFDYNLVGLYIEGQKKLTERWNIEQMIRKIYEIMKFCNFQQNVSWTVDMNMQINELMMSSPHFFPHILYKILKMFFFFFCSDMYMSPISKYIRANIILHLFRVNTRQVLRSHSWSMGFLSILWTKLMEKIVRQWHHWLVYWYNIDCSRNVSKNMKYSPKSSGAATPLPRVLGKIIMFIVVRDVLS